MLHAAVPTGAYAVCEYPVIAIAGLSEHQACPGNLQ